MWQPAGRKSRVENLEATGVLTTLRLIRGLGQRGAGLEVHSKTVGFN